jgi:phosphatidate cytidylyltransferase
MSCIAYIRGMDDGACLIWAVIIGSFASDSFAYFTGVFLGKHKLCPKISPKKSVEGAIGGVVGAVLLNSLLLLVFKKFFFQNGSEISYIGVGVLSAILSPLIRII